MPDPIEITWTADTAGLEKRLMEAAANASKQLDQIERAQKEAAAAGKDHARVVASLEREMIKGLKPYEKTALRLERLRRTSVEGADAQALLARTIAQTTERLEDQHRRDFANKGRSLSMLFDEQNAKVGQLAGTLSGMPGIFGQIGSLMHGLSASAKATNEGLSKLSDTVVNVGGALFGQLQPLKAIQTNTAETAEKLWEMEAATKAVKVETVAAGAPVSNMGKYLGTATIAAGAFVVAGVAVAGGLVTVAANTADANDQLIKLAESTGLSATELSRYQQVAEKTVRGGIQKMAEGLQRLNSEPTAKVLSEIGITSGTTSQKLSQLADWYVRTGNTSDRSAVLTRAFGDGLSRDLAPALALGAEGLESLLKQNDRFNRTLTDEAIKATGDYKDRVQELEARMSGLGQTIANAVLPPLNAFLGLLVDDDEAADALQQRISELNERLGIDGRFASEVYSRAAKDRINTNRVLADIAREQIALEADVARAVRETTDSMSGLGTGLASLMGRYKTVNGVIYDTTAQEDEYKEALRRTETGSKDAARESERLSAAYEKVLDAADPTRVKTREYEQALADLKGALDRGLISQLDFTHAVGLASMAYSDAIGAIDVPEASPLLTPDVALPDIGDPLAGFAMPDVDAEKLAADIRGVADALLESSVNAAGLAQNYMQAFGGPALGFANALSNRITENYQREADALKRSLDDRSINQAQYLQRMESLQREAAMSEFRRQKALGITQGLLSTAQAALSVFASTPGGLAIKTAAAGLATAFGLGQVALIASEPPPSFHTGGVVGGRDASGDVPITAQSGEAILTQQGRALVGDSAIEAANRGQRPMAPQVQIVYDRHIISRALLDDVRAGGVGARAIGETRRPARRWSVTS